MFSNRLSSALVIVLAGALASCAGGDAGDEAGAAPGGNVGFGGAQDIGQFRNILETGGIPGAGTLDAAGFFAEHYVELPPPDCDEALCLQSMLSVGDDWLYNGYQATLAVALNTPVDPSTIEPRPRDFVVVVDTSGSMNLDDRIGYVKQGLELLVDTLGDEDNLALVTYASDPIVRAEFALDAEPAARRAALHEEIAALEAGGSTNLYGGLQTGFDLAQAALEAQTEGRELRVLLLSDGLATAGITSDESIIAMAEEYLTLGIGLTTIGVGLDFNVELMRGLAERGAGNFYFLENPAAVSEVFTEEVTFFASPLALDVTVEVRTGNGYEVGAVAGTRLWYTEGGVGSIYLPSVFLASRTSTDPGDDKGRRGGGGTLFIEMLPTGRTDGELARVAEVKLRYRVPGEDTYREQAISVENPANPGITPEEAYYSHQAMAKQYAMYNLYLGLHQAAETAAYDYHCALSLLMDLDQRAESWNLKLDDADLAADRELIGMFMANLREAGAIEVPPEQECSGYYYDEPFPYDDDEGCCYDDDVVYGCSAAGGPAGTGAGLSLMMLLLGALLVSTRRRRRA
ncbi:vWA domain-containing protein [Haliangium sp.]|uniref:vWA domain-containing protein n=1 Tax=Haliangium sp. TaxID=2663208 RepID=UPI003D138D05